MVSHLLDEVVAAAVERSLEPILLDGHILDRLASVPSNAPSSAKP